MKRTHISAPLLGIATLAAVLAAAVPACAQTVTVTDLTPAGFADSSGYGVSGNSQVGSGDLEGSSEYTPHALLWKGTAASVTDLHPAAFGPNPSELDYSQALGISGNTQVGSVYSDYAGRPFAVLWHGTADSIVSLDNGDSFSTGSVAYAASGDAQVGYTSDQPYDDEPKSYTAQLWHGTADSAVELNAYVYKLYNTLATGVSGNTQVGFGFNYDEGYVNALLWHGTSDSVLDLNPAGYLASYAYGASGDTQVGKAFLDVNTQHAALWRGTAVSFVDLHPAGYLESVANGAADGAQVGFAAAGSTGLHHAVLWRGTAKSALDLHAFLPAGYMSSTATGVSGSGGVYDVVGTADSDAFVWHVVFAAKPTVLHLYPASRTVGRDAFTLTVAGTGFTAASQVQWNGAAQTTTFVNSTTLTAQIPGALIATAGTAQITVNTPGVGTSNSHVETIMPRPTLSSLSPSSKKAGSGAFTLTVTGTGFRPASFYAPSVVKWNGMELATTFVSDTELTASVPAALVAHAGTAQVMVTTPQVATTGPKTFTITP